MTRLTLATSRRRALSPSEQTVPEEPTVIKSEPSIDLPPSDSPPVDSLQLPQSPPVPNIHVLPIQPWEPSYHFDLLQEWEGSVLSIDGDRILVRLIDKTRYPIASAGVEEEFAELSFDELADEDRPRVRPGAVFSWDIGYRTDSDGRARASQVRFRRLPAISGKDIQRAQRTAREMRRELGWD